MNTLAKKPYDKSPYDVLKELRAPWLDELRHNIMKVIVAYAALIHDEARLDGLQRLENEDFLYERFVDNVASKQYFANWEVFKYFSTIMRMKMYKEFIGDWTFTNHDVEMYDYFSRCRIDNDHKCTHRNLKFKSVLVFSEDVFLDEMRQTEANEQYKLHCDVCDNYKSNNFKPYKYCFYAYDEATPRVYLPIYTGVNELLTKKMEILDEMINHCKMCASKVISRYPDEYHYFNTKGHWIFRGWGCRDFSNLPEVFLSKMSSEK